MATTSDIEIPKTIVKDGREYELKKPAFECWHWKWNCCGVQCDWNWKKTHLCRDCLSTCWAIFKFLLLTAILLSGPIYLITKTQPLVNACRELDGQPRQDCLLEDGVAAQYAFGFTSLFFMAFVEFLLVGGNELFGVNYSPRKCTDCSPNMGCCDAIGDVIMTTVYFALLFVDVFCGTFLKCGLDCSGNDGFIAGTVICSVVLFLWSLQLLLCGCFVPETQKLKVMKGKDIIFKNDRSMDARLAYNRAKIEHDLVPSLCCTCYCDEI